MRWFGAVQAQDFNAAKWALGLRMRTATNAVVEEAFNRGEIVRTHVLRSDVVLRDAGGYSLVVGVDRTASESPVWLSLSHV